MDTFSPTACRLTARTLIARTLIARSFAAIALVCAAASSQAAIVSFNTLAAFAGTNRVSVDTFSDQTINTFVGPSLVRSAGGFGYEVSSPTGLFIAPVAGSIALSTESESDPLVFSNFTNFSGPVFAFGANFFATNPLGEVVTGTTALVLQATDIAFAATDINGLTFTTTLTGNATTRFMGFRSDVALARVSARITNPLSAGVPVYVTADNITFVPEPSSLMLVLAAGLAIPLVRARRRV